MKLFWFLKWFKIYKGGLSFHLLGYFVQLQPVDDPVTDLDPYFDLGGELARERQQSFLAQFDILEIYIILSKW